MAYLTPATYAALTIAPAVYVAQVESDHPGWLEAQLSFWSGWIDARLKKRYAAPFDADSPPPIVLGWLTRILDAELYLKRGVNANDSQHGEIVDRAALAKAEIREAADAAAGLFELPLRADTPAASGVTRGAPLGYTEQSPYTWPVVQRAAALGEGL